MINRFLNKLKKPVNNKEEKKVNPKQIFSTHDHLENLIKDKWDSLIDRNFKNSVNPEVSNALDSKTYKSVMDNMQSVKSSFYGNDVIPQQQIFWYANQTFIGYQLCAMIAQHWLVSKACLMPAEDAVRKGYEITVNDGTDIDPKIFDYIRDCDNDYDLKKNLIEFIQFGRIFGIRIAMFKIESDDPEYYFKPFNPDGITPGSYKGISQIDPYWVTPQLSPESAGDPSSIHFYEPTWWNIAGKLVHRTHLIIYRTEEVADLLKPSYIYGGIPIPQKIYERVYASERVANEAPMLALTKRTDVINVDLAQALANQPSNPQAQSNGFTARIMKWVYNRDNYGIKILDLTEKLSQFDTSLTDLDAVIMTQYQLVAAIANIPAVKLMGTSPKGFNATGEFEESNYHEMLESLQQSLTKLIDRHHTCLIRSNVCPEFDIKPFNVCVSWKPLDAMTSEELAILNKTKAETGQVLINSGAIDGNDERDRIISDPMSGYSGIEDKDMLEENENDLIEEELDLEEKSDEEKQDKVMS